MEQAHRLSRKEKRSIRQGKKETIQQDKLNFNIKHVEPLTQNQKLTFQYYEQNKNLLLIGSAGSGKTFLSIFLAIKNIITNDNYKKIYICRSIEPSKQIGFLPGSIKEKIKIYETPYQSIFSELFNRGDAYEYLKNKGHVEFISTSYIRGITLDNCIVIVDEIQNLEWNELYAIMTRVGKNCKIIFAGDYRQSDLKSSFRNDEKRTDILKFIKILKQMNSFATVEFGHSDIIRSSLVKEFIIKCEKENY